MLNLGIYFFKFMLLFSVMPMCALVPAKVRGIESPGEDGCVMIYVCAGNQTRVLCKKTLCVFNH